MPEKDPSLDAQQFNQQFDQVVANLMPQMVQQQPPQMVQQPPQVRQSSGSAQSSGKKLGTFKVWNQDKHFGFITGDDGTDVFVHAEHLVGIDPDSTDLKGKRVSFVDGFDEKKQKWRAEDVCFDGPAAQDTHSNWGRKDDWSKQQNKWGSGESSWNKSWESGKETPAADQNDPAKQWLANPPREGLTRYVFHNEEPLGLCLSKDKPPCVLDLREGAAADRKEPKITKGAVVIAVNGYEQVEGSDDPVKYLSQRPVTLDVKLVEDREESPNKRMKVSSI